MSSTLRQLAKAYATNKIDKDKYRNERAAYVGAVISGKLPIHPNQQDTASLSSTFSGSRTDFGLDRAGRPVKSASISTYENVPLPDNGNRNKKIGMVLGALCLIALIMIAFVLPEKKQQQQAPLTTDTTVNTPATDDPPSASQNLIRLFLDSNNWSGPSLDNFLMEWNRLAEADRAAAQNTIELGQMTNAIYKKLLEEKALSSIGNPETSYEKQRILVQFASDIGIDDPRITLPETPAQPTI